MNPEILEHMKRNCGIALDKVDENNIRKVIIFQPLGHYCGYIGIPEDNLLYGEKPRTIEDTFRDVHGGITYRKKHAPQAVQEDDKRLWVGFDYNQSFDGKDFDLVAEIYGEEYARQAKNCCLYGHRHNPVSYEKVLEQVEWMAETAGDRMKGKEEEMER